MSEGYAWRSCTGAGGGGVAARMHFVVGGVAAVGDGVCVGAAASAAAADAVVVGAVAAAGGVPSTAAMAIDMLQPVTQTRCRLPTKKLAKVATEPLQAPESMQSTEKSTPTANNTNGSCGLG